VGVVDRVRFEDAVVGTTGVELVDVVVTVVDGVDELIYAVPGANWIVIVDAGALVEPETLDELEELAPPVIWNGKEY